jgi:hypothetical protein
MTSPAAAAVVAAVIVANKDPSPFGLALSTNHSRDCADAANVVASSRTSDR